MTAILTRPQDYTLDSIRKTVQPPPTLPPRTLSFSTFTWSLQLFLRGFVRHKQTDSPRFRAAAVLWASVLRWIRRTVRSSYLPLATAVSFTNAATAILYCWTALVGWCTTRC